MNEMTTTNGGNLPALNFTREQIDLIKNTVAKGTTDDELALFLYAAKRTGLDPLVKQIHAVKRGGKNGPAMTIQTAIDGYRLIADRTGKYAGNDDPVFDNEEKPTKATVTVYKIVDGQRCAFTATARWNQYYPGDAQGFMWKKMPHLMLGKCAEALALRKAFPAELSGVYTHEEMAQADATTTNGNQEPIKHPTKKAEVIPAEVVPQNGTPKTVERADGVPSVIFVPVDVNTKTGETKGKTWTKWGVRSPDGKWFGTFDTDIAQIVSEAKENGTEVELTYKSDGKYNTIIDAREVVKQ